MIIFPCLASCIFCEKKPIHRHYLYFMAPIHPWMLQGRQGTPCPYFCANIIPMRCPSQTPWPRQRIEWKLSCYASERAGVPTSWPYRHTGPGVSTMLLNCCHKKQVSVDSGKISWRKTSYFNRLFLLYCTCNIIVACCVGANLFAWGRRYFIWNAFRMPFIRRLKPPLRGCGQAPLEWKKGVTGTGP